MSREGGRRFRLRQRRWPYLLLGVVAAGCVACLGWISPGLVEVPDRVVFQEIFVHRNQAWRSASQSAAFRDALEKVAVITIDSDTLGDPRFHEWPLPRRYYAEMIEKVESGGAKAIALDICMDERQSAFPGSDDTLGRTLDRHANVILAGNLVRDPSARLAFREPYFARKWDAATRKARVGVVATMDDEIRSLPLVFDIGSDVRYSLDVLLVARALNVSPSESTITPSRGWFEGTVRLGDLRIPVQGGGLPVNYFFGSSLETGGEMDEQARAPQNHVKYVPFNAIWDMTQGDLSAYFRDRLVLVGVTALEGEDIRNTPRGRMPGIDVHLNVVLGILSGEYLRVLGGVGPLAMAGLFAVIMATGVALVGVRWGALLLVLLLGTVLWAIPVHLGVRGIFFPPGVAAPAVLFAYTLASVWRAVGEQRASERLARLVKEVAPMPDDFIQKYVASKKEELALGGRKVHLSVLFTDIRGYTDMSERMDPVAVMNTLNAFYTEMGNIVHHFGGGILDYVGDAQLVVFGLDEKEPTEHADLAVAAAIAMLARLRDLNEQWTREQRTTIEIGVGICTGDVSMGVMGSGLHKQYSVIGDTTNVAARLQALSKELGSHLIISESTHAEIRTPYPFEQVTGVKVKGKAEPMTVYRLLAQASSQAPPKEMVAP